jgi:MSHA biogenesis protein MshN
MSLINKMLQDLDARGTPAGEALPAQIKAVEREPRRPHLRVIAAGVAGVAGAAALGWFVLLPYLHRHAAPQIEPVRLAPHPVAKAPAATPPAAAAAAWAAASAPLAPAPAAAAPAASPAPAPKAQTAALAPQASAPHPEPAHAEPAAAAARPAPVPAPKKRAAQAAAGVPAAPAASAASADGMVEPVQGRHTDARQRAEAEYRRALASMQDGRMTETVAALEAALRIDPAHAAARQTLVGLLVEAGRGEDAMRQAQLGLTQDPRQIALAMLLARLQIEHGGDGIAVLMRTLPYAGNDADYRAFLAGALERQQRHAEAAEQYAAALRTAPDNGVWWMGLGIALQADKRNGEALDAFQKARAAGLPSQDLVDFVERHIQQLGR